MLLNKEKSFIVEVKEINGEYVIDLPKEVIEQLQLREGDVMVYDIKENGVIYIFKKEN